MSTSKRTGKGPWTIPPPTTVVSILDDTGDLNESTHSEISQEQFDAVMEMLDEWIELRESYCEFIGATRPQGKHQKLLEDCRTSLVCVKEYRSMIQSRHQVWWALAMFAMARAADSSLILKETINRFVKQSPIRATRAKRQKVQDRINWLKERIQEQEMTPEEVKGNSRKQLYEQYLEKWRVGKKTFSRDLNRVQA